MCVGNRNLLTFLCGGSFGVCSLHLQLPAAPSSYQTSRHSTSATIQAKTVVSVAVMKSTDFVTLVIRFRRVFTGQNSMSHENRYQRRKKVQCYLPPLNVFGGIWRSFGSAA